MCFGEWEKYGEVTKKEEKLGRNREGHLKANNHKLIIFNVSTITFYLNYVNKAKIRKSRKFIKFTNELPH